jgi:hypothetical protein
MSRLGLRDRLNLALGQDPRLVIDRKEAETHPGFPIEYFEELGMNRSDLKKLVAKGLALRGYTKNVWAPGEPLPNGREADAYYHGRGRRDRYVLIADTEVSDASN